jgi:hypothetical protein
VDRSQGARGISATHQKAEVLAAFEHTHPQADAIAAASAEAIKAQQFEQYGKISKVTETNWYTLANNQADVLSHPLTAANERPALVAVDWTDLPHNRPRTAGAALVAAVQTGAFDGTLVGDVPVPRDETKYLTIHRSEYAPQQVKEFGATLAPSGFAMSTAGRVGSTAWQPLSPSATRRPQTAPSGTAAASEAWNPRSSYSEHFASPSRA